MRVDTNRFDANELLTKMYQSLQAHKQDAGDGEIHAVGAVGSLRRMVSVTCLACFFMTSVSQASGNTHGDAHSTTVTAHGTNAQ